MLRAELSICKVWLLMDLISFCSLTTNFWFPLCAVCLVTFFSIVTKCPSAF